MGKWEDGEWEIDGSVMATRIWGFGGINYTLQEDSSETLDSCLVYFNVKRGRREWKIDGSVMATRIWGFGGIRL